MPPAGRPGISNRQADLAGDAYRAFARAGIDERRPLVRDAIIALRRIIVYRSLHAYPLRKVTMGVRQMIATELGRPDAPRPGQRLKRMDRITPKLVRFPHMRLSQMEDIGGCRAVFDNLGEVYAVAARIQ